MTHTTAFVTPVVEHWLEGEIAQWVYHHEGSIRRPIAPRANSLTTELRLAPSQRYPDRHRMVSRLKISPFATFRSVPVVEHWHEREIAKWVHHEGSIRRPIAASRSLPALSRPPSDGIATVNFAFSSATVRRIDWVSIMSFCYSGIVNLIRHRRHLISERKLKYGNKRLVRRHRDVKKIPNKKIKGDRCGTSTTKRSRH